MYSIYVHTVCVERCMHSVESSMMTAEQIKPEKKERKTQKLFSKSECVCMHVCSYVVDRKTFSFSFSPYSFISSLALREKIEKEKIELTICTFSLCFFFSSHPSLTHTHTILQSPPSSLPSLPPSSCRLMMIVTRLKNSP